MPSAYLGYFISVLDIIIDWGFSSDVERSLHGFAGAGFIL